MSAPSDDKPSWHNEPSDTMVAASLSSEPSPQKPPNESFVLHYDYPCPSLPSPDWCLIRVRAAGLNRAELRGRAALAPGKGELNIFQNEYHEDPPKILGEELVGEIEQAGSNTDFLKGEIVTAFIYGGGKAHDGAYAQYSICHKRRLYRLPFQDTNEVESKIGWSVLGSIPMSMWTAYGSVFEAGRLGHRKNGRGQTGKEILLVRGGTSSVGIWAILLAKDRGFEVVATTRKEEKVQRLKDAGADYVILDHHLEEQIPKQFPDGVDVTLELVGPDMIQRALSFTARYGSVVCTGVLTKNWDIDSFRPAMIPTCRNLTFYGMTNRGSLGSEDEGLDQVGRYSKTSLTKYKMASFGRRCFLTRCLSWTRLELRMSTWKTIKRLVKWWSWSRDGFAWVPINAYKVFMMQLLWSDASIEEREYKNLDLSSDIVNGVSSVPQL